MESSRSPESSDVLVHSFKLDANADTCSLPFCYPGKQAMFHVPTNLSSYLSTFISHKEATNLIEDINKILLETAFVNTKCNPSLIICIVIGFLGSYATYEVIKHHVSELTLYLMSTTVFFLPYIFYFGLLKYQNSKRKERLISFINKWTKDKGNGVSLSLGGAGTVGGVAVGSYTGCSTYEHFYSATRDPKSLLMKGYLHVIVNYEERSNWCQQSGLPFIAAVPLNQQTMEHQGQATVPPVPASYGLTTQLQVPVGYNLVPLPTQPPAEHQVPDGYNLVPLPTQPPAQHKVPAGYNLIPHSQDLPPPYEEAKQMQ